MKFFISLCGVIVAISMSFSVFSQQNSPIESQVSDQQKVRLSEAELAQMLAPIALYPDSLLTHILISSTYPIEVIEAHRWLEKNDKLSAAQIAQAIEDNDWDASVKALVPFTQILNRLSDDLSWMQQLGDAFLEDETRVLASIQTLREKAKIAGNLSKMNNMDVSYEDTHIIIEPAEKEIVYVPYYDTRVVYGTWYWSSFPPVYWRPALRVHVNSYNPFHWNSGVHISFNYFFSSFHWSKRHVMVVNSHKSQHYRSRTSISRGGYAKRWVHKPIHRKGVAYKSTATRKKYYGNTVRSPQTRRTSQHVQRQLKQRSASNRHFSNRKDINKVKKNNTQRARVISTSHQSQVKLKNSAPKKIERNKVNRSHNTIQKVAPKQRTRAVSKSHQSQVKLKNSTSKQRRASTNQVRDTKRAVKSRSQNTSNRPQRHSSSKGHRGRDSKAKN